MAEPLTNAILASILHLIRRDLAENERAPPRRASLRWVPPRRAPARRWHRHPTGADQGQQHRPCSTGSWNHRHQDHPGNPARAAIATIWCTLHTKDTSRPWAVGRTTGGHHFVHGGQTSKNLCNRRRRKGVAGGRAPNKGHDGSLDH
jgi:hypothetical protein